MGGNGQKIQQKQRDAGPPGQNLLTERDKGVFVSQLNKMTTAYHYVCLSKLCTVSFTKLASADQLPFRNGPSPRP